jgi:hypothetical protein
MDLGQSSAVGGAQIPDSAIDPSITGQSADTGGGEAAANPPSAKKARTNTPWTPAEEKRLKQMRDAGNTWSEIAKVRGQPAAVNLRRLLYLPSSITKYGCSRAPFFSLVLCSRVRPLVDSPFFLLTLFACLDLSEQNRRQREEALVQGHALCRFCRRRGTWWRQLLNRL